MRATGTTENGVRIAHKDGSPAGSFTARLHTRAAKEEHEATLLCDGASRAIGSGDRVLEEEPDAYATCFEVDVARIRTAAAFRRPRDGTPGGRTLETMQLSWPPLSRLAMTAVAALVLFAPGFASAHGSTTSNLDEQVFDVAPERAEFVYSGDVDRAMARASLRYLGEQELSAEDYFRFDVPTVELVRVEPLSGIGPEFAFALPRLAAGSYAIDWEVTPVADHADSSVTFFQVTVGVADPDPVPPTPSDGSGEISGEGDASPPPVLLDSTMGEQSETSVSGGWDRTRWLGLFGAIVLIALLTTFYVIRDRPR